MNSTRALACTTNDKSNYRKQFLRAKCRLRCTQLLDRCHLQDVPYTPDRSKYRVKYKGTRARSTSRWRFSLCKTWQNVAIVNMKTPPSAAQWLVSFSSSRGVKSVLPLLCRFEYTLFRVAYSRPFRADITSSMKPEVTRVRYLSHRRSGPHLTRGSLSPAESAPANDPLISSGKERKGEGKGWE